MGQIEQIAEDARGDVDPDLLSKSLSHGERRGYLVRPAIEYISSGESIEYVFHNKTKGITYQSGATFKQLKSNRGWTILVITDAAIYTLIGDAGGKGEDTGSRIPLFDVDHIESREGIFKNKIIIQTDGWQCSIPVQFNDPVSEGVEYVRGRIEGEIQTSQHETTWSVQVLYSVEPTTFESILAHLWELKGYSTRTTKGSGDKGIDVIATKNDENILIQAKRYRPKENKIGIQQVQRVAGLLSDGEFNPTSVIVATTSEFTAQAVERASNIEGISLMTGDDIAAELREYGVSPSRFNIQKSPKERTETKEEGEGEGEADEVSAESTDRRSKETELVSEKDAIDGGSTGNHSEETELGPEKTEEGVFLDGKHLALTVTGIWNQHLTGLVIGAGNSTDGRLLALTIHNKGDVEWEWRGYDYLTIIDEDGFAYKPAQKLHTHDLPAGWQTRRINIQPETRVRYLGYIEMPPDVTISRIRYAQNVPTATKAHTGLMSADIAPDEKLRQLNQEEVIEISLDSELRDHIAGPPAGFPIK
ncbi:restriction endonuclease (plasmid) [Haloarcula salina]|uniref:restriction endonuclease n=1 Tax=Haloarcula salina TaxID=1429914 RepID=UPI003C700EC6